MLAWSIALLATILPAFPVKDFTGVRKAATRADDSKVGVVATLRYEKLPDMNQPRMNHQTFATAMSSPSQRARRFSCRELPSSLLDSTPSTEKERRRYSEDVARTF